MFLVSFLTKCTFYSFLPDDGNSRKESRNVNVVIDNEPDPSVAFYPSTENTLHAPLHSSTCGTLRLVNPQGFPKTPETPPPAGQVTV